MKLKYCFKTITEVLLDLLYPKHCAICQKTIFFYTSVAVCSKCSSVNLKPKVIRDDRHAFDEAICALEYKDTAREAMTKYKFKSIKYYASAYAWIIDKVTADRAYLKEAVLCPTPLSMSRDRAYNQTDLIARELAGMWQSDYIPDLLHRCREVSPLSKMKLPERKFNIKDAVDVSPKYDIYGKDIVLIDDIFTSGTTADECARTLKMYGARRVYVLCAMYD